MSIVGMRPPFFCPPNPFSAHETHEKNRNNFYPRRRKAARAAKGRGEASNLPKPPRRRKAARAAKGRSEASNLETANCR
jgi:hypothetical protein